MRRFVLAAMLAAFQLAWALPAYANTDDRSGLAAPVSVQLARALAENDRLTQQLATTTAERDDARAQLASVTDERDKLKRENDSLTAGGRGGGPVARPFPFGGGMGPYDNSRFTPGNCTWYVASWRPVPWTGDAIQWWPNAAAAGFPEGQVPVAGAIMVTRESGFGHVALVKAVSGAAWTVSEMNVIGLGVIDTRTISPGQVPLVGFIYQ